MLKRFFFTLLVLMSASSVIAQPGAARNEIRVQLTARQQTVLSSQLAGVVASLSIREGESFDVGDVLLELDCDLHNARLEKAQAQKQEAEKVQAVNAQLDKLGSISTLEVDVSVARASAATAEENLMLAIVDRCKIHAPFAGKVAKLEVDAYQYVSEGQPLMDILDDSELSVEMYVPSRWLGSMSLGQAMRLRIEETGKEYPALMERIGASVDAVSQSVKVYGSIQGIHPELRAGMSGIALMEEQ
jgi:membrane fusion protein (multidrug efflux system)